MVTLRNIMWLFNGSIVARAPSHSCFSAMPRPCKTRKPRLKRSTREKLAKQLEEAATLTSRTPIVDDDGDVLEVIDPGEIRPARLFKGTCSVEDKDQQATTANETSRDQRKRLNQRDNWQRMIPRLVDPYLELIRITGHLRNEPPSVVLHECRCRTKIPFKVFRLDFKSKSCCA